MGLFRPSLGLCTKIVHTRNSNCYWVVVDGTRYGSKDNQDICEDDPAHFDLPDDPTEVRVYRGQVELHLVHEDTDDLPPLWPVRTCDVTIDAELTVRPDGTLNFIVVWTRWIDTNPFHPDSCQSFDESRTSNFFGTWTGTTFTALVRDPLHLQNSVEFGGELTENFAVAEEGIQFYGIGTDVYTTMSFQLPLVTE